MGSEASTTVYKICPKSLWQKAESVGRFDGAPVDIDDGYIHFSTAEQVHETAAKHFSGQSDLILVAVETGRLGEALRWEPSRGGELFPHLYASLSLADVLWAKPLPQAEDGRHLFPDLAA